MVNQIVGRVFKCALVLSLAVAAGCSSQQTTAPVPPPQPTMPMARVSIQRTVIHYSSDKMAFSPSEDLALAHVATILATHPTSHIYIDGYADRWRTIDGNVELSRERAQDVAYFIEAEGVNPTQMTVRSHGATHPVASNKTARGRAQNRRVVISAGE